MSNKPEKQDANKTAQPAVKNSTKISAAEADLLFEDIKLEKTGFIYKLSKILKPVLARFSFLKKKIVWIPLLVVFVLSILGSGAFLYYQTTKINRPGYVLSTLENALENKDAAKFSSIIDLSQFSDNFINDFISLIQNYHYVNELLTEIPATEVITDNISFLFLDIFKDTEYDNEFNNKTLFIPKHISDLLTQAKYEIKKQEGTTSHIISTQLNDDFWGYIPIKLEVRPTNNGLKIVKLANLNEILQTYNVKLSKRRLQEQKYKSKKNQYDLDQMSVYLPGSACSARIGQTGAKNILYINYTADPNYQKDHLVAFAVNVKIANNEGIEILEETIKNNTIVLATSGVNMSIPFPLTDEQLQLLKDNSPLLCEAIPTMINTNSGSYFDTRKK